MKILKGTVVSDKMDKTAIVSIDRKFLHPLYKKQYTISKRFKVENPENKYKVGDVVELASRRPISKFKHFTITKKIGTELAREELEEKELKETAKINEPRETEEPAAEEEK